MAYKAFISYSSKRSRASPRFSPQNTPCSRARSSNDEIEKAIRACDLLSYSGVYIADSGNNRVRRVDSVTGVITTIAGNGSFVFGGDGGPAASAGVASPFGLAFDAVNNLYVADFNSRVRKISTVTGVITTVAGNGAVGFSGDGGPATGASLTIPDQAHGCNRARVRCVLTPT
jgi:hypothetical protein